MSFCTHYSLTTASVAACFFGFATWLSKAVGNVAVPDPALLTPQNNVTT